MNRKSKILIVGHNDAVENSLREYFSSHQFVHVFSSSKIKVDFLSQKSVRDFFKKEALEYIFLGSFRSGGIMANQQFAAEFIYENLECQNNIIHAAYTFGVKKLLYFTGSCAYPKNSPQPIKEEYLLTGLLEPTSEAYSIAKIAGTKLCQAYRKQYGLNAIVAVPSTIYGPGCDTDPQSAHVLGALIAKFHQATQTNQPEVVLWGTGKPRREFLYVDDFVSASLFLLKSYRDEEMINVGCGYDVSIKELAQLVKEVAQFKGKIIFDATKPDGTMRKLMDNSRLSRLGWQPKTDLKTGIKKAYQWYCQLVPRGTN